MKERVTLSGKWVNKEIIPTGNCSSDVILTGIYSPYKNRYHKNFEVVGHTHGDSKSDY